MPAANVRKPRNPVNNAAPARKRATPPPPVREDREIESWLGELRGNAPPAAPRPAPRQRPQQDAEPTTAIPTPPRPRGSRHSNGDAEPTTAIPAQKPQDPDATEKLTAQQAEEEGRRRGANGGVSAAELLRREGRGR
jgi:RND superfamily putative drug exporter